MDRGVGANGDCRGVAAAAKLNPQYAMTLFKKMCGMTIHEYVQQHRSFHARRLRATTVVSGEVRDVINSIARWSC